MCQPRLTCVTGVADRGESLPAQLFHTPPRRVLSLGVACPETDSPHGVKRAGFSQTVDAGARTTLFHGRVLREFGKST